MNISRIHVPATLSFLCISSWTWAQATPPAPDSSEATSQAPLVTLSEDVKLLPAAPAGSVTLAKALGPFDKGLSVTAHVSGRDSGDSAMTPADSAAPAGYPAGSAGSSGWSPTHFEVVGFAQWRNLSNSANISTANQGTISLSKDLAIGKQAAGPLFRFIWTPDFKILGATSKIWVEYGQVDRSHRVTINRTFTFDGRVYVANSTLRPELNTKQFEAGYAPRWGNDKFRIGPSFTYEHLGVNFILTNLTPGAPPPITQEVNVPNNLFLIGADFDYTPVKQFDVYGKLGAIPCCGGGWHVFESEFGAKYYFLRSVSLLGGVRYDYFRRDFDLPATTVNGTTVGPFSGSLKFPGVGPFVGASFRF